ncbi:MAG: LytTR family DNA-binding domain-containing protein [Bacteroidales bacterium]|jgi:DNA-binding LytR/AlgR family response regulator|nr:LytTR family DNA-binding domain-containing protein [Bacteroidales bacterium]
MKRYKVLIIDDELLARTLLTDYVEKIPQLTLVESCENVPQALPFLQQHDIDILLTDIEMPDMTGIELVKTIDKLPAVIFTTAYSEYAVEGFELNAADYLIKPISFPRFVQAINKVTQSIDIQSIPVMILKGDLSVEQKNYISIKADYKIYKVNLDDLIYIEGQSEYVTFHTTTRNITAYYALKKLEIELPEQLFVRVHKSYIVSIKRIEYVDATQVMVAGNKIPIGGNYRENIMKYL